MQGEQSGGGAGKGKEFSDLNNSESEAAGKDQSVVTKKSQEGGETNQEKSKDSKVDI